MKVKVVQSFVDKTTGNSRAVNEVFNCTKERYEEIEGAGHYVEPVPLSPKKKAERAE